MRSRIASTSGSFLARNVLKCSNSYDKECRVVWLRNKRRMVEDDEGLD